MESTDPHEVLGVKENASEEEIKSAYREMVKEHHPDVSEAEGAERRFRRIKEAYNALRAEDTDDGAEQRPTDDGPTNPGRGKRRRRRSWARDGFEVKENYEDGWRVAVCREGAHVGEWVVYKPFRSATRGGTTARYIDKDGDLTENPVHFGTRKQAETGYQKYSSSKNGDRGHGPGRGPGRDRGRRRTRRAGGRDVSGVSDETEDAERIKGLDSLWFLHRREIAGGVERWAVATDTGSKHYLNESGEQQSEGFWFGDRKEAEAAYDAYMEGAADVGGPSRNLTGGRGAARGGTRDGVEDDIDGDPRRPPVTAAGRVFDSLGSAGRAIGGFLDAFSLPWAVVSDALAPYVSSDPQDVPWRRILGSVVLGYAVAFTLVLALARFGYSFAFTRSFAGDFLFIGVVLAVLSYLVAGFVAERLV